MTDLRMCEQRVARRQRSTACELISCGKGTCSPQNKVIIRRALIVSLAMSTSASRVKNVLQAQCNVNQPGRPGHFVSYLKGEPLRKSPEPPGKETV